MLSFADKRLHGECLRQPATSQTVSPLGFQIHASVCFVHSVRDASLIQTLILASVSALRSAAPCLVQSVAAMARRIPASVTFVERAAANRSAFWWRIKARVTTVSKQAESIQL